LLYLNLFLATRLTNLTLLPAHYDEMLHLRRVEAVVRDGEFFIGLDQSLKGLQVWLVAALWWLPMDTLWIGRFGSVLAGVAGGLGCYVLAIMLYRRTSVGILAALLYLVTPFLFLYDRLALADSLLTSLGVWVMALSLGVVRHRQIGWALAAGLTLAATGLTKASGYIYLMIPLAALFLFKRSQKRSSHIWQLTGLVYGVAALGVALVAYFLLTSPDMNAAQEPGSLLLWQLWLQNAQTAWSWLASMLTLPLLLLGLAGGVLSLWRRDHSGLYLLVIPITWTLLLILVVHTNTIELFRKWYPRYLLPITPSLLILAAWVLSLGYRRLGRLNLTPGWQAGLSATLFLAVISSALMTDFWLLVDPGQAPLHAEERRQYIEDWPNAYRLAEAGDYVKQLATYYPELYLAVNESSFIVEEGLKYYFDPPSNVQIVNFDPFSGEAVEDLNRWSLERPTVAILNSAKEKGLKELWQRPEIFAQAQKLATYDKPGGQASIEVYQWLSPPGLAARWAVQSGLEGPIIVSPSGPGGDADPSARFISLTETAPAQADFVLVDANLVASGLFATYLQLAEGRVWPAQPPPGLALTYFYPGLPCDWCLFRVLANAPPQYSLHTTLGEAILLTGFDLNQPQKSYRLGDTIHLTLHWQALADVLEDYVVFAQLIGPAGLQVQQDRQPFGGVWPTGNWLPDQQLADRYQLLLESDLPPGTYSLIAGMYHPITLERLPAFQSDGHRWPDDAVVLTNLLVTD
jgi:hypothetical protein